MSTAVQHAPLGFGLMRLPQAGEQIDIEQTSRMVDAFLEAGFTYFDTAYVYNGSEDAARRALVERHPRDRYTLATKLNARVARDAQDARSQLEQSLARTGAGYFDYYLLHALQDSNVRQYDAWGLWDFVREQKAAGRIRRYGFSFHGTPALLDRLLTEHPDVDFVQLQINYADWDNPEVTSGANYEIARRHGVLLIVDASQTAGVFPIDVEKMHIDVLCFTGHKGLLGPQGTGGMYVREGVHIRPLKSGGSGVQTYSRTHPAEMPTALEAGTMNGHGIAGLHAAVEYIERTGMDKIREREQACMWNFYNGVKDIPGVTVYGDFSGGGRCPIVSLNIGDYDSSEVGDELLTEYGISTRPGAHCAPLMHKALGTVDQGAVRFSFSHYTTDEEVETAIRAIRELAQEEA